jgi:hypothetical protein
MLPDALGWPILISVFVMAGGLFAAKVLARRAGEARLRTLGFEPCDSEAERLREKYTRLAGGYEGGESRRFEVARCFRKPTGKGAVYRFSAAEVGLPESNDPRRASVAPVSDVYLIDLGARASALREPCSVFLAQLRDGFFRKVLAQVLAARPLGRKLELSGLSAEPILAAFGAAAGRLEEHLGRPLLELTAASAGAGFFAVHFGAGQVALEAPGGMRAVDAQWNAVQDWLAA